MKGNILIAVILFALCSFTGTEGVQAGGDYLGDYCWSVGEGTSASRTARLGVFHVGGGHFQLLGTTKTTSDAVYLAQGTAEIVDDKIHVSLIMGDANFDPINTMSTRHLVCIVDPDTLNGFYNMVHTGAAENGETLIRFSKGTMIFIPCD